MRPLTFNNKATDLLFPGPRPIGTPRLSPRLRQSLPRFTIPGLGQQNGRDLKKKEKGKRKKNEMTSGVEPTKKRSVALNLAARASYPSDSILCAAKIISFSVFFLNMLTLTRAGLKRKEESKLLSHRHSRSRGADAARLLRHLGPDGHCNSGRHTRITVRHVDDWSR